MLHIQSYRVLQGLMGQNALITGGGGRGVFVFNKRGGELTVAAILYRCFCVQGIKSGEYRCFQDATGGKATTCRFWVVALLEHWQCLG